MTKYQELITKPEISFWVPIITSILLIAVSWSNLTTKVELLNQKVDNLTQKIDFLTEKYGSVESRYGTISLQVQRIETKLELGPIH